MKEYTEIELLKGVQNGESDAFRTLIDEYRRRLYSYLLKMTGNKFTAEDLFQETLIKVWSGVKNYNEKAKFSAWLFTIAHNVGIDHIRKSKNGKDKIVDPGSINAAAATDPHDEYIKKEERLLIQNALISLSEKQKQVFLLRQHGELTFREISEITGEPLNTVLSHMNYAVKKIKKVLERKNAI